LQKTGHVKHSYVANGDAEPTFRWPLIRPWRSGGARQRRVQWSRSGD
jgi:hypothetical protein